MSGQVFAYGTLEAPEVVERVLGRRLASVAARLDGYARYRMRGRPYPGIVPRGGASTTGTLLQGVSREDLVHLDEFEGSFYERASVVVALEGSGETRTAFSYVVRVDCVDLLSTEQWSREHFLSECLTDFLERL